MNLSMMLCCKIIESLGSYVWDVLVMLRAVGELAKAAWRDT
jgi:hypothetical protein